VTRVKRPSIRYHGAKFRIAPWVMRHFPPHTCYVEPFGGAAGVLLQKPRAYAEVYNDLDGDVVNFFRVLRDPDQARQLVEACALTPYARDEFALAWEPADDPIERARRLAIRAEMGFGSAGATKGTTGFRVDTKREYGTAQHTWLKYPENLAAVGQRLSGVLIENRPAIEVIRAHDAPETLFYVDPPYVFGIRCRIDGKGAGRSYRHEMTDDDHADLLRVLLDVAGMVVVSGYDTELYRDMLGSWAMSSTSARISAGRGGASRKEVIWVNPACHAALHAQPGELFQGAA